MELLFLLPLLLGFAAFGFFDGGGDDSAGNQSNNVDNVDPSTSENEVDIGDSSANTFRGGEGDDFILGAGNRDTLSAGEGNDIVLGESGADSLRGDRGDDTLLGGSGNDQLAGGVGDDFMVGGSGDDYLIGEDGNDILVGSSGADTLQAEKGDDLISSIDVGGTANPLAINFVDSAADATAALADLKAGLTAKYGTDPDFIAPRDPSLLTRVEDALSEPGTSDADDLVFAGAGNDTIFADLSDTLVGGAGNDQFNIISGGTGEAVTVRDFVPGTDKINVYVPAGTNPAITYVNGATPDVGLSVIVAGDVVAVLKGLVNTDITPAFADSIVVNVAAA